MQSPSIKMAIQSLLLILCASTALAAGSTAMRVELKHLDAKANYTLAERRYRASMRMYRRFELVSGVTVPVISQDSDYYVYMAEFGIGNPPQVVQAIVSTSTDLVWTQCSTCRPKCFGQNLNWYDYHKSSTGQPVRCDDTMCAAGYGTKPCVDDHDNNDGTCPVQDSGCAGVLRTDEFTFGPAKLNITFGCMSQAGTAYDLGGASGFIGLGRGALSLISQVGSNRFSYCLTRHGDGLESSPLFIGSSAGLSGDAPVTTSPFYPNIHVEPFSYILSMTGMSVGEASLNITAMEFHSGVIIDAVVPGMYLVDAAYIALKKEMSRQLGSILVPSPVDWVELCVAREDVSMIAPLVLHLGGGDLALPADNYWAPIDLETSCMVVMSSAYMGAPPSEQITIIGSYMQQNLHVLYDLEGESISFQPADCASI